MREKLFTAIQAGDVEAVRALVKAEPGLASARDERGISAVRHARYRMNDELVEVLLATEPELDVFDAAALGRDRRLREHLDREPALATATSGDGGTALHLAAFFGTLDGIRLLAPTTKVSKV